jgi:hypothetical protein
LESCVPAIDYLDRRRSLKTKAQHRALFLTLTDCWNDMWK